MSEREEGVAVEQSGGVADATSASTEAENQSHVETVNEKGTEDSGRDRDGHRSTDSAPPVRGASQYQLVFMEDLSSESSLAGSLSPKNLEASGSFIPVPTAETTGGNMKLNTSSEDLQRLLEADENRSTVSSSTLVAESNFSCETAETLKAESSVPLPPKEDGGGEGEREEEEVKEGAQVVGEERERGVSPSDEVMEDRAESVTPPPKPKEHPLSRLTSDSDAIVTPPLSPVEYHSSEEDIPGDGRPTFPLMTPSPLPPGADSPDLGELPVMSILFSGVFYLGSSTVDAPISETEANRKMNILHEQALSSQPMSIILSVPITNDGSVLLKDPKTDQPLTTFPVKMILFCARGGDEALQDCFCLNVRHKRSGTYHCHVFRCEIPEAVSTCMHVYVHTIIYCTVYTIK